MKFKNETHRKNYEKHLARCRCNDCWNRTLIYTLTMDRNLVVHIDDIYDFTWGCIKPECIHASWQTGGSSRLTRLAFQLFTNDAPTAYLYDEHGNVSLDVKEFKNYLLVENLSYLSCDWEYVVEAIRIGIQIHDPEERR